MPLDTLRLLICSFCELWMVSGDEGGLSRPHAAQGDLLSSDNGIFFSTHAREPGNEKIKIWQVRR